MTANDIVVFAVLVESEVEGEVVLTLKSTKVAIIKLLYVSDATP